MGGMVTRCDGTGYGQVGVVPWRATGVVWPLAAWPISQCNARSAVGRGHLPATGSGLSVPVNSIADVQSKFAYSSSSRQTVAKQMADSGS